MSSCQRAQQTLARKVFFNKETFSKICEYCTHFFYFKNNPQKRKFEHDNFLNISKMGKHMFFTQRET